MGDGERIRREHFAAGAIYGTVVYLTILVLLGEDRTGPEDATAILVGTAFVFWLAHVYAHLVPRIVTEGRLRTRLFVETARDQVGILASVVISLIPLGLAMLGLLEDEWRCERRSRQESSRWAHSAFGKHGRLASAWFAP